MTTAIQQKPNIPQTLRQQIAGDYFKQQVALALPKHMTPDRFVRVGLTALMKTPKLMDCTPESVIQCMLHCSALGLEPDGRRAHLIPYGTTCTLVLDYKGMVELAKRSGDVSNIFAQIVCDKDSFEWENGEVKHRIDWRNPRGEMYAAYAVVCYKDGGKQTEVMTKFEIDAIRKRSKASGSGPWVTDYNEMARKTVVRRVLKMVTLSPEIVDAMEKDETPYSASTLVTDLGNQTEALPEPPPTQEAAPVEVVAEVKEQPKAAPSAPAAATGPTMQQQLADVVTKAGHTFDDFCRWSEGTGNVPDCSSLSGFDEIHETICRRLLRSQVGMLKGIAAGKGQQ